MPPRVQRTEIEILAPDQIKAVLDARRGRPLYPVGHSNPTVTLGVYAHLFGNTDHRAAAAVETALPGVPARGSRAGGSKPYGRERLEHNRAGIRWQAGGKQAENPYPAPSTDQPMSGDFTNRSKGLAEGMGFEPTIRLLTV